MNYFDEINRIWLLVEGSSLGTKIEKSFESAGFKIKQVQPEPEPVKVLLERIEIFNPAVVALEARCSGFDSFELCRQFKAAPRLKSVPHIVFGYDNHAHNSVKAFRAGADYYVALAGEDCLCLVRLVEKLTGKRHGMA